MKNKRLSNTNITDMATCLVSLDVNRTLMPSLLTKRWMVKGKRDVDGIEFLTYHLIELFFKLFSKIYCQILDTHIKGQLPLLSYYYELIVLLNIVCWKNSRDNLRELVSRKSWPILPLVYLMDGSRHNVSVTASWLTTVPSESAISRQKSPRGKSCRSDPGHVVLKRQ